MTRQEFDDLKILPGETVVITTEKKAPSGKLTRTLRTPTRYKGEPIKDQFEFIGGLTHYLFNLAEIASIKRLKK